jgi:hypothetical protein
MASSTASDPDKIYQYNPAVHNQLCTEKPWKQEYVFPPKIYIISIAMLNFLAPIISKM